MADFKPISESYWVEPGALLAGEHPGHWDESVARRRIVRLLDAGIRRFVDLSHQADPVHPYHALLAKVCRDRGIVTDYLWMPLRERQLPRRPGDVEAVLRAVQAGVEGGQRTYLHCSDGVGRTGMVLGCWLVERGLDPAGAMAELARRFAAMNKARDFRRTPASALQHEWVERWSPRLGLTDQGHARAS